MFAGALGIAGVAKQQQQGSLYLCLWEESGLEWQLVQERKISGHSDTILLMLLLLSVSWERPAWSLPLRSEWFQHLDNEKSVF